MTKRNRWFLTGTLAAGVAFMSGGLASWQLPKIKALVLLKIEQTSRDHLPVRVLPGALDISFWPLGVKLERVSVRPKDDFKAYLNTASFDTIRVAISPWQLLRGKLRLTELEVAGAKIDATIPAFDKNPKQGPPLAGLFDVLNQVPINAVDLSDISAKIKFVDPALSLAIDDVNVVIEKRRGGVLALDLRSAQAQVFGKGGTINQGLRAEFEARALLARNTVQIETLKIRRGDSYVHAEGQLKGDVEALSFDDVTVVSESDLNLESLRTWAGKAFPDKLKSVPALKGRASFQAKTRRAPHGKGYESDFQAKSTGLKIDDFFADKVSASGSYIQREKSLSVKIPDFAIDNPAGLASLKDLTLEMDENDATVAGKIESRSIQAHELLKSLGVGTIPVYLQISGEIPCQGKLKPQFLINCKGRAHGNGFLLRTDMKAKGTLAAIKDFDAEGEFSIDKDKVTYATELAMPNSKGRSSGTIGYETGFKIAFEGDKVAFADVANLSDLKLEGTMRVKGSTEGDSDAAVFQMDIDGTDFWLEDFWLGNAKGAVAYRKGRLSFSGMQGYYTVSRYSGDVNLDVENKTIAVSGRLPFFDIRDVMKVFSRRVKLPFAVTGTGQAQIRASGPLDLAHLSYDLKSSVFRGSVASEPFDEAHFDVKSVGGEVKAERVQVSKGPAVISLTGQGHPDGTIQTLIKGREFKLENSVIVSASGLSLSGLVDFDMDMKGPVLAPDTELRGRLTKTSIGDQGVPDSQFKLRFASKSIAGDGVFLGDVLSAQFVFPYTSDAPFSLKMNSREWNFAPLFAAISGPSSRKDFEGRLTSVISLQAPTGGFWNATGSIDIEKFSLARGATSLATKEPIQMSMKNGQFSVGKFELAGENAFLKVSHSAHPTSKLDLQTNGKLDLALLSILTPFFEDLRGTLSLAFNLRAGPQNADLLGSAYVEKGYLKFFDFPHPIEDIRIDLLFNQKKVLINTVKAEIGGGRASGSGGLEFKGSKNIPVTVSGQFEKVTMNVPDKVRTSGSGNFSFTGNWFPFVLKVGYTVKEGLVTKELGGDSDDSSSTIRRDQFLPELLLQERFTPVVLDLDIDFTKGLQVKNELVDGRVTGTLSVKGPPAKPSLVGAISMDKESKIIVKDTQFEVTTANFEFTDPNEINPKLYLVARARVQEYDVNLLLQGTAAKPEPSFTSVPPLAEKDIISLLALGTTDARPNPLVQTTQTGTTQAPQISAVALKNNPLSKEIKEKTGFDLQFEPNLDESSIVQKITVKRQFTNKFSVSASQAIGNKRSSEAEARYKLNDKISGVLSFQNKDSLGSSDKNRSDTEQNKLGLDLEYKLEFK